MGLQSDRAVMFSCVFYLCVSVTALRRSRPTYNNKDNWNHYQSSVCITMKGEDTSTEEL